MKNIKNSCITVTVTVTVAVTVTVTVAVSVTVTVAVAVAVAVAVTGYLFIRGIPSARGHPIAENNSTTDPHKEHWYQKPAALLELFLVTAFTF
jgi:hypothetical protein